MKLAQRCCGGRANCGARVCYGTLTVGLDTSTPSGQRMLGRFTAAFNTAEPMMSRSLFVAQCTLLVAADGTLKATVSSKQLSADVTRAIEAKLAAERFAPGAPGRLSFQVVNTW
jgi:hypothetical protein